MARNRIIDHRTVRAGDLLPDPRNWRLHPEAQSEALNTMLERVGWADSVIVRKDGDDLILVNGHLRASMDPEEMIPAQITDLSFEEAGEILATLDSIELMAEVNHPALLNLLDSLKVDDARFGNVITAVDERLEAGLYDLKQREADAKTALDAKRVSEEEMEKQAKALRKQYGERYDDRSSHVLCPQCGFEFVVSDVTIQETEEGEDLGSS